MTEYLPFDKDEGRLSEPVTIEHKRRTSRERGESYVIDDHRLVAAINASLVLGRPLLLTGEPGTGKTTLADRIAWFLALPEPLIFETRSSSVARDLFYTYDALGRFQASHPGFGAGAAKPADFLSFSALGRAILETHVPQDFPAIPPDRFPPQRSRRVVVIDEVDKAHRDFPNDLLMAVERMSFTIPEIQGLEVSAADDLRPIVVITSNSEKNLPDAFLRRCVYHHIPFPDTPAPLVRILAQQVDVPFRNEFLESCVRYFLSLRKRSLRKKPSTAELVDWVRLLAAAIKDSGKTGKEIAALTDVRQLPRAQFERATACLAKFSEDVREVDRSWDELVNLK